MLVAVLAYRLNQQSADRVFSLTRSTSTVGIGVLYARDELYKTLIRPVLFAIPAETAHAWAVSLLNMNILPAPPTPDKASDAV